MRTSTSVRPATDTTYSTSAYDVLDLPVSLFANAGDYNIKLTADGYADVEYKLTVGDSSSSGSGGTTTEVAVPTKAPNLKKHDSTGFYYELAFTDADKAWSVK